MREGREDHPPQRGFDRLYFGGVPAQKQALAEDAVYSQAGVSRLLQKDFKKNDMKSLEGFRMRKLGREHILVGESVKLVNFNKMIVLNETAAFLWEQIEGGREFTVEQLAAKLVEQYEISMDVALADSAALVDKWLEAGVISE